MSSKQKNTKPTNLKTTLNYKLSLINGQKWTFMACSHAVPWLKKFAAVLKLKTGKFPCSQKIIIIKPQNAVHAKINPLAAMAPSTKKHLPKYGWVMFNLDELLVWKHPHCDDILVAVMAKNNFISRTRVMWKTLDIIFQQTIPAGGFPLHAALIKFKNQGFLILSRGGIGKTTCYRRVRKPWEAICDDEVLVCSRNGKYYVHACPTWGNLVCKMDKQSQNIENPIPLTAILLLKQAKIDKVSPVKSGQTAASLVQRAIQIARRGFEPLPLSKKLKLSRLIFNHACQVAKKIPAYTLAASLTGKFWKKIPLSPARV